MNKILIPALILPFSLSAMAGDYQFEANAYYAETETGDLDTDLAAASFSYYFNRVDDSKGPLAEAAFINKASSVTVSYAEADSDLAAGGTADSDAYGFGVEYVVPESNTIIGLRYAEGESNDEDADQLGITVGKYLSDKVSFTVDIDYLEFDLDNEERDNYGFNFHYLSDQSENKRLGLDIGLLRSETSSDTNGDDDFNSVYALGTIYITDQLGISAGWEVSNGGEDKGDTVSVSTKYFINSNIALELGYAHAGYTEDERDSDKTLMFGVTGRF